ncbi:Ig-like domain-containing protein [Enterococcus thailandicus]|uniref:pectate lyase-like adhesive domain-containing protein n=1 Tax=Enterococcus thailandicus TaxID=417368 RepID=UPI0022EBE49E|nr:pectate lyase-like adhesive domain-containing protein [Enterococcus thailandicus]MDA3973105.1 Ig-like domain-containing protein [Enterococcus thailandicus]MDA3975461.1 Ig-like domain-containing protein [Enterococcus thailandicus]MDA3980565.1 Ig-like domain-containing protein [Enterococcus thailandicus]
MFKGKIVTLMLSSLLATNISPIVNTFSSDSIPNTSETMIQNELLEDTSISERLKTDTSDQQTERSDTPTEDSTQETLSSSEEEIDEGTSDSSDTVTKSSEVEAKDEDNAIITAREADVDGVEVSSWSTFVQAIRNETVTKIVLTGGFENPSNTDTSLTNYSRKNDLEIDGRGYRVDFKSTSIQLGSPTGSGNFHMHDIVLNQRYGGANSEDIVGTRLNYTNGGKWRYRFGNITTEPDVQRLARASHSEVTVYGKMNIDTRAENFYLGSLKMEDGTNYKGNVNYYNFSIFWYNVIAADTSTGASKEFTIGKNCRVDLTQSQTTGTTYPAVYSYYQALTVGENSTFNVNMPGNAVRFDMDGAGMTVKAGAIVNLTSKQNSGSVVAYSNDNNYLIVDPGAYFYTIGVSNQPLINLSANGVGTGNVRRQNNKFILNSPAQYDIRNLRDGYTAVQVAMGNYADNLFQIVDSDIDLWKLATQPLGPSDETYTKVAQFSVTGNGSNEKISATTSGLNSFSQKNYRRISGMNQNPIIEWVPVTDADKTIKARVIIGYVPDNNGLNVDGEVNYIPVYASKNQANVTITDTHGKVTKDLLTDENGYASYQSESFNLAGKDMQATAQRGPWISEEVSKYLVIDVTPPEPAIIDSGETLSPLATELSGNGEADAIVTITVNGEKQTNTTTVSSEGKWTLPLSGLGLKKDDVLQIFLQDTSGKVTQISDPPKTNNEIGNIQPAEDYSYRDAVFKAATKIIVIGTLELKTVPDTFDFGTQKVSSIRTQYRPDVTGNLIVSDTRGAEKNPWRVLLKEKTPLTSDQNSLAGQFYYTNNVETINITSEAIPVEEGELSEDGEINLSNSWNDTKGLSLQIPIEKQILGTYKGTLEWTLEDVP